MATPRLNKEDPSCGLIHPPYNGAIYTQGGHYFSGSGEFLFSDGGEPAGGSSVAGAPAPVRAPALPGGAAGDDPNRVVSPLKPVEAETAETSETSTDDKSDPVKPSDVDLMAWVKGEKKWPFYAVKKRAIAEYPDIITTNSQTIAAGLVTAGFVAAKDVKV